MREDSPCLNSTLVKSAIHIGLFLIILLLSDFSMQAQVIAWDKTLGGNKLETLTTLQQTSDGGFVIGGYSSSEISGHKSEGCRGGDDYWIVRLDENGNKQWDRTLGGNGNDHLTVIQQTQNGGYILAGYSNSGLSGDKSEPVHGSEYDFWVVRLDANGNKIWDRTLGGDGLESPWAIVQTSDGGYIIGGSSTSGKSGDKTQPIIGLTTGMADFWLIKLDQNGTKLWDRSYGSTGGDFLKGVLQTADGGLILAGNSFSNAGGDKSQDCRGADDYWVLKLDANGIKQWDRTYGGNALDRLENIKHTSDGGYILGGTSYSGKGGEKTDSHRGGLNDFWVVKISNDGTLEWDKTIGGNSNDEFASVQQTSDGGYIIGGYSHSVVSGEKSQPNYGGTDYWITQLNSTGSKEWDHVLVGDKQDNLSTIVQAKDGSYILGGYSFTAKYGDKSEASLGGSDFWVVKLLEKSSCTLPMPSVQVPVLGCSYAPGSVQLTAQGENIRWYTDIDLKTLVAKGNIYHPIITANTSFYVTQTLQGCESDPQTVEVQFKLKPPKPVPEDAIFCEGEKPVLYIQGQNIIWYEDADLTNQVATGNNFIPTLVGSSTFYATQTVGGCESDAAKVRVQMSERPTAPIVNDVFICYGTLSAPLLAQGTQINWYADAALTSKVGEGNQFFPANALPGRLYVTQRINGCESAAAIAEIKAGREDYLKEKVTNIITPNGDGLNDAFVIPAFADDSCIGSFNKITILNRWGKTVYESEQSDFAWKAEGQIAGVFFYVLSFDRFTFKGSVTVNR